MLADIVPVDPDNFPHGGSNGATMRFPPETDSADNSGLEERPLRSWTLSTRDSPWRDISNSDLWVFAAYVATKWVGGPVIDFVPGRIDADLW